MRHSHGKSNLTTYLQARGSTFAFMGFFIAGLAAGSICCITTGDSAGIIRSIVANELSLQMERSFIQLILSAASGFMGIFIFIYLCINCSKGAWLIYLVPLVHGLSVGSMITVVLYTYSFSAFFYVLVCIFVPKLIETLLLLSLCNKSARYCKEQFSGQVVRHKSREVFPIWLYLFLFVMYFMLEGLLTFSFRWLL